MNDESIDPTINSIARSGSPPGPTPYAQPMPLAPADRSTTGTTRGTGNERASATLTVSEVGHIREDACAVEGDGPPTQLLTVMPARDWRANSWFRTQAWCTNPRELPPRRRSTRSGEQVGSAPGEMQASLACELSQTIGSRPE